MKAGKIRALDKAIATEIMGIGRYYHHRPPIFTSDIEMAYEVIERMDLLYFSVGRERCAGIRYDAACYDNDNMLDKMSDTAGTAPLAICLAAWKWYTVFGKKKK